MPNTIQTGMLTLFAEISCISIAIFSGILAFRNTDRFFKTLLLQVTVWGVFYGLSHVITLQQQAQGLPIDNRWLMNVSMILETGLLLAAAWFVLPKVFRTPLTVGAFLLFLGVAALQSWKHGFGTYLNYADTTACLVNTVVYTAVLYTFGQRTDKRLWHSPEKWACLGILLYYACSVPYLSMMHYLEVNAPKVNTFLYYLISNVLADVRYLLLAVAFLMIYRSAAKQRHTP